MIRDGEGEVISAGAGKLSHLKDAPQAEIRECMQGAKAAADLGMGKSHFGNRLIDSGASHDG